MSVVVDPFLAGVPDSPYGVTEYVPNSGGNPPFLSSQLVSDLVGWGQGTWLRYQLQWQSVEQSYTLSGGKYVPVYTWNVFDDAVQKCNAAGINLCWNIQSPPLWRTTIDPATGLTLPANGTTCNTTLSSPISAGVTPNPGGDGNAQIQVVALPAGQSLTSGQQIAIGSGSTSDAVLAAASYGAGTTTIEVTDTNGNVWIPQNSHSGPTQKALGASVINAGAQLEGAADTAQFAKAVASRYNGQAGHGLLQAIQIGNEEFDTYAPRDLQSQWLVPVVNAAAPAIRAVHPSCRIGVCAVRKTPNKGLAHISAWMTNLFTYQGGIGRNADWLDFHFYRDGTSSASPDPNAQDVNTPSIVTELTTIQQIAAQYGQSPEVWCGETGWNIYDDGTGRVETLTAQVTPTGGPYTHISLSPALSAYIPSGGQIYIDYGNSNQEVLYASGNAPAGSTSIAITPVSGSGTAWTPTSTHVVNAPVYIPAGNIYGAQTDSKYLKEMYDGMRQNGGAKCFIFTLVPGAAVLPYTNIGTGAGPGAVYSTIQKGITQHINGTYTYLAPYTMTSAYAQQYPTWSGSSGGTNAQVMTGRFLLASLRSRKLSTRFNLQSGGITQAIRKLAARYRLTSLQPLWLSGRFLLQGTTTHHSIRKVVARYRLSGGKQTVFLTNRVKLVPGSGINAPSPPDANPSFFAPPMIAVRCGIGTYQPLFGSAALSVDGGFPLSPGTVFHPYAGLYGGTYGYLLDTTIKQPQETAFTPAQEIGLDTVGVSVVRGYPQITWTYTTMRPDYWYYLQWLYQKSARVPSGYQYLVLLQYPSRDGTNTPVQQLARMNPPTYTNRTVAVFNGVSLTFTHIGQAILDSGTPIQVVS